MATMGTAIALATSVAACSSTTSSTSTTAGSGGGSSTGAIPQSAFSDHTGITANSVTVGNISTLAIGGLFKGAPTGVEAYAAYINSMGGINGRKLIVQSADDGYTGQGNTQGTQNAINNDFALVGNFSLDDNFGGKVLAQNPGVPDVSEVLDSATGKLPNVFQAVPLADGWQEGPIQYFAHKFPNDINAVGALVADSPSAEATWDGEKYVLEKVGMKVIYDQTYTTFQTDFTQNVIAMKAAGVKILLVDQLPALYASGLLKDLAQQNWHPIVILGAPTYTSTLIQNAGGAQNVNGDYLDQDSTLYLGEDASDVPAVNTFLTWVHKTAPGFVPDLYTMYGWINAEMFADALAKAGSDPSRGSVLQQLAKITSYDADGLVGPNNPAGKKNGNCYIIGQVTNGSFRRLDDPPVTGPTKGFRCDYSYVTQPGT